MSKRADALVGLPQLGAVIKSKREGTIELAARLLRVRDRQGRMRPLRANAAQRSFEARRGQENVVLKARQMGMTTWIAARFFLRTMTVPGTTTLLVAHTREASEAVFGIVQRFWTYLPVELREGPLQLRTLNAGRMEFAALGSEFRVASAGDPNAGRGLSVQQLHCSEVSRWPGDVAATLAGLRAALAPGGELVLESTPQGAYGAFYEAWRAGVEPADLTPGASCWGSTHRDETAMGGAPGVCGTPEFYGALGFGGGMVRHFLPWWMEPAYLGPRVDAAEMTHEEAALVERHGLSGEQIGFRRGLERRFGTMRSQEFAEDAESCFRSTGACCFEVDAMERRLAEVLPARWERRNGALQIWLPPCAGKRYVVAVDTAGGGADGDFAAVQVAELTTGLQCAELQERLRPAALAPVCAALAREYNEALVVVERNNHGAAVLAFLETEPHYGRLYRQAGQAGWLTTAASKPEMVAQMGAMLRERPECFLSRRLLAECRTFVADERGRAGAAPGAHDDLVMAMAMAQAVRAELLEGVRGWS